MAIKLVPPPAHGLDAVRVALDDFQRRSQRSALGGGAMMAPRELLAARRDALTASVPHPVHDLGLDALLAGADLDAAPQTGWRYLIEDGEQPVAIAEVPDGATTAALRTGRFTASVQEGIRAAERLEATRAGDHELRVLRVPALYLLALWLRRDGGDRADDTLIPLSPAPPPLVAGAAYRAADLLASLQPLAATRRAFRE